MQFLRNILQDMGRQALRAARELASEFETRRETQAIQKRARLLDWTAEHDSRQRRPRIRR